MISLGRPNSQLEVVLAGAVAATECPIGVSYVVTRKSDGALIDEVDFDCTTNGATAVVIVPPPKPGYAHTIKGVTIFAADSSPVVVTVRKNNGSTTRILLKPTLAVGSTLEYAAED